MLALVAVPGAQGKVYAPRELTSNTLRLGHSSLTPSLLIAPDHPRREDLGGADFSRTRRRAELHRRFAANGGVQEN